MKLKRALNSSPESVMSRHSRRKSDDVHCALERGEYYHDNVFVSRPVPQRNVRKVICCRKFQSIKWFGNWSLTREIFENCELVSSNSDSLHPQVPSLSRTSVSVCCLISWFLAKHLANHKTDTKKIMKTDESAIFRCDKNCPRQISEKTEHNLLLFSQKKLRNSEIWIRFLLSLTLFLCLINPFVRCAFHRLCGVADWRTFWFGHMSLRDGWTVAPTALPRCRMTNATELRR